jgi:hypothetical protein
MNLFDLHEIQDRSVAFRPGEGMQCVANVKYQIQWDGTEEDLIALGDYLQMLVTGRGMDSLDLGDTMGAIMLFLNDGNRMEFELVVDTGTLRATTVPDLFKWEGVPD